MEKAFELLRRSKPTSVSARARAGRAVGRRAPSDLPPSQRDGAARRKSRPKGLGSDDAVPGRGRTGSEDRPAGHVLPDLLRSVGGVFPTLRGHRGAAVPIPPTAKRSLVASARRWNGETKKIQGIPPHSVSFPSVRMACTLLRAHTHTHTPLEGCPKQQLFPVDPR